MSGSLPRWRRQSRTRHDREESLKGVIGPFFGTSAELPGPPGGVARFFTETLLKKEYDINLPNHSEEKGEE